MTDNASKIKRLVVDGVVIGLVVAMGVSSLAGSDATLVRWLLFVALVFPLVWWRRFPEAVFAATFALALTSWTAGVDSPHVLAALLIAVFSVVRRSRARIAWIAPTVVGVTFLASWILAEPGARADLILLLAALGIGVLLATTLRVRADRARLRELQRLQEARFVAARQRARMAREVHDVVSHNVAVMTSLADAAALAPDRSADLVAEIAGVGRRALDELQRVIDLLRDGEQGPGVETIEGVDDLVRAVRSAGLQVSYETAGAYELTPAAGLAVYRIVQEALTNTLKHAGPPTAVDVKICCSGERVDVLVRDHGAARAAMPPKAMARQGKGIAGMAERVADLGGVFAAGPHPAGGWTVKARLGSGSREADR